MSASVKDGCLYVTKSVRIPIENIFIIRRDRRMGQSGAAVITDMGKTLVTESFEELASVLPGLCVEDR